MESVSRSHPARPHLTNSFFSWLRQKHARVGTPESYSDATLTVSRSLLVERLFRENSTNPQPAPIAYFYCARSEAEPEQSNPGEILRCILEQLSSSDAT